MAAIQDLVLRFKVQGGGAAKALKEDIRDLVSQSNPLNNSLGNVAGKMGLVTNGAFAAAAAFALLGMRAFDLGDQLDDLSNATGISSGQLMNLRNSLVEAGGDAQSFEKAAIKLSQSIGESASGNEKLQKSFRDLGVFVTDANGKVRDTGDILEDVLAALSNIEDPTIRQAKAIELLGKEAAKIDWSNVRAGRNIEFDAAAKNMAELRGEIDKLRIAIDEGLLLAFGNLAQGLNKFGIENLFARMTEGAAGFLEKIPGIGMAFEFLNKKARESRLEAEKAITAQQQEVAGEMARLLGRAPAPRRTPTNVPGGGQGATPEATLKAIEDSRTRIAQSGIEERKLLALRSADEIQKVQINTASELEKARTEIFNKERLSQAQKTAEYTAKAREISAKAANDIAKIEEDNRRTIFQQRQSYQNQVMQLLGIELSELDKINQQIAQQPDKYKETGDQMRANAAEQDRTLRLIRDINQENDRRKIIEEALFSIEQARNDNIDFFLKQQERIKQLAEANTSLERAQLELQFRYKDSAISAERQLATYAKFRQLMMSGEIDLTEEQAKAVYDHIRAREELNVQLAEEATRATQLLTQQYFTQREFSYGWADAYANFVENSRNAADQARTYFETFTRGIEDAFIQFAKTGKLSFKDLVNTMIAEVVRFSVRAAMASQYANMGGLGGFLGKIFGFSMKGGGFGTGYGYGNLDIGGFLAGGGPVMAGTPYVVGEMGPELFVPRSAGTVVPNHQLAMSAPQVTNVNYTIQAVDASSFRQLVARDPAFIYAVTERGRQSQPTRRVG